MLRHIVLVTILAVVVSGQYQTQDDGQYIQQQQQQQQQGNYYNNNDQPTRPPIQILSHKQALNHDGAFKYGFAAENGLQQGETILPDGSRTGGYRYIDAHGKTISIKYTAGKEGFRILEGDHIPKAPVPVGPQAAQAAAPAAYQQAGLSRGQEDDGQYRPELYQRAQVAAPLYRPAPVLSAAPQYTQQRVAQQVPQYRAVTPGYNPQPKEQEYYDEPGKANSFGAGYSFEFQG